MIFSASTSRSGLSFHTASADKFLKGATTGANAGGTGGSTTNVHSISHTHTTNSHTHGGGNTSETGPGFEQGGGAITIAITSHTHTFTVASSTQDINTYSGSLTTTETVQPAYRTLNAFKNTSGSNKLPAVGDIALWLGSLSSIPIGWKLCDGSDGTPDMRDRYYKNPSSASASTTGGSNTHSHVAQSHTHGTGASHYHSVSYSVYVGVHRNVGSGNPVICNNHGHYASNSSSVAVGYASQNTSANSSSNEPEYRTVAFIQFELPPVIPNPILMMMVDTVENWA